MLDALKLIAWIAEQSDAFKALVDELYAIQESRGMTLGFEPMMRTSKKGEPVFVISCENGYHESLVSHEAALESLVDSHRTRAEDKPETHIRMMEVSGKSLDDARNACAAFAKEIRDSSPSMSGHDRDIALLARIESLSFR